jgi:hypothetical protein
MKEEKNKLCGGNVEIKATGKIYEVPFSVYLYLTAN